MNLEEAVKVSLHAFLDIQECETIQYAQERVKPVIDYLRAALAEDAMQRLTDVEQEMEAVTICHEKGGGRVSTPLRCSRNQFRQHGASG